jgi:hypothetical protein
MMRGWANLFSLFPHPYENNRTNRSYFYLLFKTNTKNVAELKNRLLKKQIFTTRIIFLTLPFPFSMESSPGERRDLIPLL